jgi:hypothetical protein
MFDIGAPWGDINPDVILEGEGFPERCGVLNFVILIEAQYRRICSLQQVGNVEASP